MNDEYTQKLEAENLALTKKVWDQSEMIPRLSNLKLYFSYDMCGMSHDILSYDITLSHNSINELSPTAKCLEIKKYTLSLDNLKGSTLNIYHFSQMFRTLREDLAGFYNVRLADFSSGLAEPPWTLPWGIGLREGMDLSELAHYFHDHYVFEQKIKTSTRWARFKQFVKGT